MKRVLFAVIILMISLHSAGAEEYDISGLWYINGDGFAKEKLLDVVKVQVPVSGTMNVYVSDPMEISNDIVGHLPYYDGELSGDIKFLTGYDLYIRIDLTRFGFRVWDKHMGENFSTPVPLPEMRPSVGKTYRLFSLRMNNSEQDMTYTVTLASEYSGTIAISGIIKDVDIAREIEIASDSAVWSSRSGRPVTDSGVHGGCSSWGWAFTSALILLGVWKFVRH